jgi:hypothetical protein
MRARGSLQRRTDESRSAARGALHFMNETALFMSHAAPFVNNTLPLSASACSTGA